MTLPRPTRLGAFAFLVSGCLTTCAIGAPAAPAASVPADNAAAGVKMELLASGAMEKLGGYRPQQLKLNKGKPTSVKQAPEIAAPLSGQIRFGGKNYTVVVDEPEGGDAKLYVDSNGNGDLTDDPACTWEKQAAPGPDGKELTQYKGSFQLPLSSGAGEPQLVTLGAYRFDKNDPRRAQLKSTLLYYSDYAYAGDVTLGGGTYKAILADDNATGQFGGAAPAGAAAGAASRLIIDLNGDGTTATRGEVFESNKPFNVKGTTYELAFPGGDGAPFKVAKSSKKVAEIPLPPNLNPGQTIASFKAKNMDGKAVNFPADYKGKVVMLDFWATWCGPCREEIPGLVSAYNAYHDKGFEVLGISLDQANQAKQVKDFMKEQGMTWAQVYDGKFWKAAVAEQYAVNSIPACYLVDGDTGEILAADGQLRGGNLTTTIEAALAKKADGGAKTAKASEKPEATPGAKPEPDAAPAAEPAAEPKAEEKKEEAKPDAVPF